MLFLGGIVDFRGNREGVAGFVFYYIFVFIRIVG